ncbi:MAG: hypothetical protein JWP01_2780 [Myxococcales bacterium]|nr:hypothetical protein [Myxococcales bacterium]
MLDLLRRMRGIRSRTDLLNHLARSRSCRRYLEIGVRDRRHNFDKIQIEIKHGVDPNPRRPVTHPVTSDEFFRQRPASAPGYDLVFIDGLHLAAQVEKDVENSLAALAPGGAIVLHDCNPLTADAQTDDYDGKKHWNGTVWKAWAKLRATRTDLQMCVVDIDEGCGVIERGTQAVYPLPSTTFEDLTYDLLASSRRELLNLISVDAFLKA